MLRCWAKINRDRYPIRDSHVCERKMLSMEFCTPSTVRFTFYQLRAFFRSLNFYCYFFRCDKSNSKIARNRHTNTCTHAKPNKLLSVNFLLSAERLMNLTSVGQPVSNRTSFSRFAKVWAKIEIVYANRHADDPNKRCTRVNSQLDLDSGTAVARP